MVLTTGQALASITPKPEKKLAAIALGRLGRLKDGGARAEKLSKSWRKKIARQAAQVRRKKAG